MSIFDGVIAPEIKVEFDLSLPLGPKETFESDWQPVSLDLVRAISIRRGKTVENQLVQAGECTITFDNRSGDFDPMNEASPYWQTLPAPLDPGLSYISPRLGVRVIATWANVDHYLFQGYLEQITMDWGLNPTATITFTDGLAWLAQQQLLPLGPLDPTEGNGDTVYERCLRLLDQTAAAWPLTLRWMDSAVDNTMYGTRFDSGDLLSSLQTAADCEPGRLFMTNDGKLRLMEFVAGYDFDLLLTDAQDGSGVGYDSIDVDPGAKYLVNRVTVTKVDATGAERGTVVGQDATSIVKFGISEQAYTLPTNRATPVAQALAYQYSEPFDRVRRISFSAVNLGTHFQAVLATDIADFVTIDRTTYDGRTVSFSCIVEGIEHDITPESWRMTYLCSTQGADSQSGYWVGLLGLTGDEPAYLTSLFTDTEGSSFMAGRVSGGSELSLTKVSSDGVLQWQQTYPDIAWPASLYLRRIANGAATPSGNLVLAFSLDGTPDTACVMMLDPEGEVIWRTLIETGTSNGYVDFYNVATDSAGNVLVPLSTANGGQQQASLVKLSASTGAVVWQYQTSDFSLAEAYCVSVDGDDNIFVAGRASSSGPSMPTQPLILKVSPTGSLLWARGVESTINGSYARSVAAAPDGGVFVSMLTADSTKYIILAKFDADGTSLWQRTMNNTYDEVIFRGVDSLGDAYASPDSSRNTGYTKIIKVSETGGLAWRRVFYPETMVAITPADDLLLASTGRAAAKVPANGTLTGTYDVAGNAVTYGVGSGSLSSTYTFTVYTPTLSWSAASLTVSADSLPATTAGTNSWDVTYI